MYKIVTALLLSLFFASSADSAGLKVEDEIKYRQSAMMFMRWNMSVIKQHVLTHPETFDKHKVVQAADVIAATANSDLASLFSRNSKDGKGWKKTRIKHEYFTDAKEVAKRTKAFQQEARTLAEVARSADVKHIRLQFDSLFKACKSCHKKFRSKD